MSTQDSTDKFIQFPLAFLAVGSSVEDRLDKIIAWVTMTAGRRKLTAVEEANNCAEAHWLEGKANVDDPHYDSENPDHRAWAMGSSTSGIGYSFKCVDACLDQFRRAERCLGRLNKSPNVRIAPDILRDAKAGTLPYLQFACVCSVYAIIGSKKYTLCRRRRIIAGMLGYSSARELFDENGGITREGQETLEKRSDGARPVAVHKLRTLLDKVEDAKFFARFNPSLSKQGKTRKVYFGRGCSHEELARMVAAKMVKQSHVKISKEAARAVFESLVNPNGVIKEETILKGRENEKTPINNENISDVTPRNASNAKGSNSAAHTPHDSPHGRHTDASLITASFIDADSNNCLQNNCKFNSPARQRGDCFSQSPSDQQGDETDLEEALERLSESKATGEAEVEDQRLEMDRLVVAEEMAIEAAITQIRDEVQRLRDIDRAFGVTYTPPTSQHAVVKFASGFHYGSREFSRDWFQKNVPGSQKWTLGDWKIEFLEELAVHLRSRLSANNGVIM